MSDGQAEGADTVNKQKYIWDANWIFLLCILSSQWLTAMVARLGVRDSMVLQILIEVFLLLPGAVYLFLSKRPLKQSLGINSLTGKQWLMLIPLAICMVNITEFVNLCSQLFVKNSVSAHMMDYTMKYPFPVMFFTVAIVPALCEETMFRGVIYQGYRRSNILIAILLSSFLFGIMHMNLNQFSYAFVLGILFCLFNEATGSFLPSVIMHLFINGRSIVMLYGVIELLKIVRREYVAAELAGNTKMTELLEKFTEGIPIESEDWLEQYMSSAESVDISQLILASVPMLVVSVIGVVLILRYYLRSTGRMEHFKSIFRKKSSRPEAEEVRPRVISIPLLVGCALCIYTMFQEYFPW